jgi:hypothetical protein
MAIEGDKAQVWIEELFAMASIANNPILREVADAIEEGVITGRLYFNQPAEGIGNEQSSISVGGK